MSGTNVLVSKVNRGLKSSSLLMAIALLLLTTASYAGLTAYKLRTEKAHAAGWTTLNTWVTNPTFGACKTLVNTAFGPVYQVKILTVRTPGSAVGRSWAGIIRGGVPISSTSTTSWWNNTNVNEVSASALLGDTVSVAYSATATSDYMRFDGFNPAYFTNC